MNISITISDTEVKAALQQLQAKVGNLKPAMDEIGQRYERRLLEGWSKEQSPDGTPWAKLSLRSLQLGLGGKGKKSGFKKSGSLNKSGKSYLQSKSLLVQTGRMRSRVHYQADSSSMTIGINGIPYAAIHQFGGMAGRGRKVKIPARPWLGVNKNNSIDLAEQDKTMVLEVIAKHLSGNIT